MTADDKESRRKKILALRDRRRKQAPSDGRKSMSGLWAGLKENEGEGHRLGTLGQGPPPLQKILKNPQVRQMLINFLSNTEKGGGQGGEGGFKSLNMPDDMGFERMDFGEELSTSSSLEEMLDYRRQLENRCDWMEALLDQTVMELERVNRFIQALENPEETAPDKDQKQSTAQPAAGKEKKKKAGKGNSE